MIVVIADTSGLLHGGRPLIMSPLLLADLDHVATRGLRREAAADDLRRFG